MTRSVLVVSAVALAGLLVGAQSRVFCDRTSSPEGDSDIPPVFMPLEVETEAGDRALGGIMISAPVETIGESRQQVRLVAFSLSFMRDGTSFARLNQMHPRELTSSERIDVSFSIGSSREFWVLISPKSGLDWRTVRAGADLDVQISSR